MFCNVIKWIIVRCFCLLLIFNTIHAITETPSGYVINIQCQASNGSNEENDNFDAECCDEVVKQYYKSWSLRFYLSSFLEILQTRNCPQFKQECERRTFDFTDFTSLIYLRFCNRSLMEEQCYDDIQTIVKKQNKGIQIIASTFDELVLKLNLNMLGDQDIMNSCIQVAMFDMNAMGHGQYYEAINLEVPFCEAVWCGFNKHIATSKRISDWSCMPTR